MSKAMVLLIFCTCTLFGCSFGGFDDKSTISAGGNAIGEGDTRISGIASKGIFHSGTAELYAVNGSGDEALLKRTAIGPFGTYSASVGVSRAFDGSSYTGVVLVKVSGSYRDEATGATLSVPDQSPLRAAIANPSGAVEVVVTPLTELAVRRALQSSGGSIKASDVTSANTLISRLFKVDILATEPVMADLTDSGFGNAATTQEQKDYTLALAAVSWLAREPGSLAGTLDALASGIDSAGMKGTTALSFRTALDQFLASDKNLTGVVSSSFTNLANVGGDRKLVKISIAGRVDPPTSVNGITLTLDLPPGVTVRGDFTLPGVIPVLDGVVAPSAGVTSSTYLQARYLPAGAEGTGKVVISMADVAGFPLGEVVTVVCEIPPGVTTLPGDFRISDFTAKDGNGQTLPGVGFAVPVVLE